MATNGKTYFEEDPAGVQETVLEEGVAEPMGQADLRLDGDAEKSALRAWFEPLIEPVAPRLARVSALYARAGAGPRG